MIDHKNKILLEEYVLDPAFISADHIIMFSNNNIGHFIETYIQISED